MQEGNLSAQEGSLDTQEDVSRALKFWMAVMGFLLLGLLIVLIFIVMYG